VAIHIRIISFVAETVETCTLLINALNAGLQNKFETIPKSVIENVVCFNKIMKTKHLNIFT
jgi:hypothetical protein